MTDIAIDALISAVTDAVQDSYSVIYTSSGTVKGPMVCLLSLSFSLLSTFTLSSSQTSFQRFRSVTSHWVPLKQLAKRSAASTANLKDLLLMRRAPNETASLSLFQKYQFFTTGINMVIGVSLLFFTILVVGVTWVGSIQTPVRFEGKVKRA